MSTAIQMHRIDVKVFYRSVTYKQLYMVCRVNKMRSFMLESHFRVSFRLSRLIGVPYLKQTNFW